MFDTIKMQEITLAGDRFWLTVPPTTVFKDLIESIWNEEIKNTHRMWGEAGTATFYHTRNDNGTEVLRYKLVRHVSGLDTDDIGGSEPHHSYASNVFTHFRPCLIPVGKNGLYDETFRKAAANGSIFRGGYLMVKAPAKKGKGIQSYHGDLCHPDMKDCDSFRFDVQVGSTLSIVNDWGADSDPEPPLEWFFFNGILICTYNLCNVMGKDIYRSKLFPTL